MLEGILVGLLIVLPVGDALATAFFFSLFLHSKRTTQVAAEPRTRLDQPGDYQRREQVANRPRLWGGPSLFGGRSWLLGLMTGSWALITVVFVLIGYLSARRLLGQPPLAEGAVLISIALVALGLIPIAFAIAFYMTRRKRGGPPPFSETD